MELAHKPVFCLPSESIVVTAQKAFFLPQSSNGVVAVVAQLWEYTENCCYFTL